MARDRLTHHGPSIDGTDLCLAVTEVGKVGSSFVQV